jgi:hypothetical protein
MNPSLTISYESQAPAPKPDKKHIALIIVLGFLLKQASNLIKQLTELLQIFFGLLLGLVATPQPLSPQSRIEVPPDDRLYQLEARAVAEMNAAERKRLLSIVNGMEIS